MHSNYFDDVWRGLIMPFNERIFLPNKDKAYTQNEVVSHADKDTIASDLSPRSVHFMS